MTALDALERLQVMNRQARSAYLAAIAVCLAVFGVLGWLFGWADASVMLIGPALIGPIALWNESLIWRCRRKLREHGR